MKCRRCEEEFPAERNHTEERCITVLRVRVYDAQLEAVMLRREIQQLKQRGNIG
jgi:hypothetical protein